MDLTATTTAEPTESAPPGRTSRLRQYVTVSWVIVVVAFTIGRVVFARATLATYGLNIWVFGFIDLITAVPYAVGVAKVVTSMIDHEPAKSMKWGAVAVISFLAPYMYVAWAGKDEAFPASIWTGLVVLLVLFGANALWNVARKVKRGKLESAAALS